MQNFLKESRKTGNNTNEVRILDLYWVLQNYEEIQISEKNKMV
jgi:hypothetical protein